MDISPPAARIESAAIVRRRTGLGGAGFALLGLMLYVALGCWLIRRGLPYHDGALHDVAARLDDATDSLTTIALFLFWPAFALQGWSRFVFPTPGVIAVNDAGLILDRGHTSEHIDPEDVLAGDYDVERGELVLRLANGAIRAKGVALVEAEALLSALAAGATDRALDLTLQRRATALRVVAAILAIPLIGGAIHVASASDSTAVVVVTAATLALAWAWLTMRFGSPTRLLVGHDGLALHGGGKTRFLPWKQLDDATTVDEGIALFPRNEQQIVVKLLAGRERYRSGLARMRRDHLAARIQRELASRREASVEALGASHLDRGDRSLAEWRAALRALVTRPSGGYRRSALDPDHLASVLWSRDVTPERRLGAALALAATDDPAARQRVRVFIDTCADEALRVAVERAAEGELDDAELDRALQRIARS